MKKIITLMLLVVMGIGMAKAAKLYVNVGSNSWWSILRVYAWNSENTTQNNGWHNENAGIVSSTVSRFGRDWYEFDMGSYNSAIVQQGGIDNNNEAGSRFKVYNKTYDISGLGTKDKYVIISTENTSDNDNKYKNDNNEDKYPYSYGYHEAPTIRNNVDNNWSGTSSNMTSESNNTLSRSFSKSDIDGLSDADLRFRIFNFGDQIYPSGGEALSISVAGSTSSCINNNTDVSEYFSVTKPTYNYTNLVITATYNNSVWTISADAYLPAISTNASGYSTYTVGVPVTIPVGVTAYYATDDGDGSATAHAITDPAANTPMLIKGAASTSYSFAVAASGTDYSGTNAFKAGTSTTAADGLATGEGPYNYILNGNAFYAANGKKVAEGKAYLQLSQPATTRALVFPGEKEAGISVITNTAENVNAIYNLSGQRVANPSKGLYIVNGHKVIMK